MKVSSLPPPHLRTRSGCHSRCILLSRSANRRSVRSGSKRGSTLRNTIQRSRGSGSRAPALVGVRLLKNLPADREALGLVGIEKILWRPAAEY
jgi:hypothetical protein